MKFPTLPGFGKKATNATSAPKKGSHIGRHKVAYGLGAVGVLSATALGIAAHSAAKQANYNPALMSSSATDPSSTDSSQPSSIFGSPAESSYNSNCGMSTSLNSQF